MAHNHQDLLVIVLDVGKSVSITQGEDTSFFENSCRCVSMILQRKIIADSKEFISVLLMGSNESENVLVVSGYDNIVCKFQPQLVSWDMLKYVENEIATTEVTTDWIDALVVAMEMIRLHSEEYTTAKKHIVFFSDFSYPVSDDKLTTVIKNIQRMDIEITIIGPHVDIGILENLDEDGEPSLKKFKSSLDSDNQNSSKDTPVVKGLGKKTITEGEKLITCMLMQLEDKMRICSFELALKQLSPYVRKTVRPTPWNANLDIGEIEISISAYKKTDRKRIMSSFKTRNVKSQNSQVQPTQLADANESLSTESVSDVVRDKIMYYKRQIPDSLETEEVPVQQEEVIEGYTYGSTIVPFSGEDKKALSFKSGPKCISIIGFTNMTSVPHYLLSGECAYYVCPRDKDEAAETALSALIQAMHEMKTVALARKVTIADKGLSLGVLFPLVDCIEQDDDSGEKWKECLLYIDVAFEEEIRSIGFPSLENFAADLTNKQLEAVDNLIDDMDLMNAEKDLDGNYGEALDITSLHDFKNQFYHYCVIRKALDSEQSLPKRVPDSIKEFISLPKSLVPKQKACIDRLKDNFKLEIIKSSKKEETDNEVRNIFSDVGTSKVYFGDKGNTVNASQDSVNSSCRYNEGVRINDVNLSGTTGTSTSVNGKDIESSSHNEDIEETGLMGDFKKLFKNGKFPVPSAIDNLMKYYVEDANADIKEVLGIFEEVLNTFRKDCVNKCLEEYNHWIRQYKAWLYEKSVGGMEVWKLISKGNLGLITEDENSSSIVTDEEAVKFLEASLTPAVRIQPPKNPKPQFSVIPESLDESQLERQEAMDCLFD